METRYTSSLLSKSLHAQLRAMVVEVTPDIKVLISKSSNLSDAHFLNLAGGDTVAAYEYLMATVGLGSVSLSKQYFVIFY